MSPGLVHRIATEAVEVTLDVLAMESAARRERRWLSVGELRELLDGSPVQPGVAQAVLAWWEADLRSAGVDLALTLASDTCAHHDAPTLRRVLVDSLLNAEAIAQARRLGAGRKERCA